MRVLAGSGALARSIAFSAMLACGSPTDLEGAASETVAPAPTAADLPVAEGTPEPILGPNGDLLESDQTVHGLVLPRGLEVVVDEERRHVYRTRSSVAVVLAYFGTRLTLAEVERTDRGATTYRQVRPTATPSARPMDVAVAPTSGSFTRIEITLAPPEVLAEPSLEEARARLEALTTAGE